MHVHENLTRKWRSKNFDEIIGQELSVRLLKNSLKANRFFPVYLLSGLRGTGKTSMGRIFAAAVNCRSLSSFQDGSIAALPCLTCESCKAMAAGKHPDFIEVDAASHTGVDNVRQIIETASFLPSMGIKKIYLVDEAHMLSKAAFNAFLKILEEPPSTALFLLATTDPQKIIDTVTSRSFQLFFDPIAADVLQDHLARVCDAEGIGYEALALEHIVQESDGAVRDALNLVERVRLAHDSLTVPAVKDVLGLVDDASIEELFGYIVNGSFEKALPFFEQLIAKAGSSRNVWKKMVDFLRALIWAHHGISLKSRGMPALVESISLARAVEFLDLLFKMEQYFVRTSVQESMLEYIVCKMMRRYGAGAQSGPVDSGPSPQKKQEVERGVSRASHNVVAQAAAEGGAKDAVDDRWASFVRELAVVNPLIGSILQQGTFVGFEQSSDGGVVSVSFAKKFAFYHDWLNESEAQWRPLFGKFFGDTTIFSPQFEGEVCTRSSSPRRQSGAQQPVTTTPQKTEFRALGGPVTIKDEEKWAKAHALLKLFPGTVRVVKE